MTKENRNGSRRTLAQQYSSQLVSYQFPALLTRRSGSIPTFPTSLKDKIVSNPSKDLRGTQDALSAVIETLIDDQQGFRKIGEEIKDEELKRFFLDESLKRAEFRGELENILHREGVKDVKESGTAAGSFLRLFTGLKTALGAGTGALLDAAEEAEQQAAQAYTDALDKDLPGPIREVLVRQAGRIEAAHDYVSVARDKVRT